MRRGGPRQAAEAAELLAVFVLSRTVAGPQAQLSALQCNMQKLLRAARAARAAPLRSAARAELQSAVPSRGCSRCCAGSAADDAGRRRGGTLHVHARAAWATLCPCSRRARPARRWRRKRAGERCRCAAKHCPARRCEELSRTSWLLTCRGTAVHQAALGAILDEAELTQLWDVITDHAAADAGTAEGERIGYAAYTQVRPLPSSGSRVRCHEQAALSPPQVQADCAQLLGADRTRALLSASTFCSLPKDASGAVCTRGLFELAMRKATWQQLTTHVRYHDGTGDGYAATGARRRCSFSAHTPSHGLCACPQQPPPSGA